MDLSRGAVAKLTAYKWPGNVRELVNSITRAVIMSGDKIIQAQDIRTEDEDEGSLNQITSWPAESYQTEIAEDKENKKYPKKNKRHILERTPAQGMGINPQYGFHIPDRISKDSRRQTPFPNSHIRPASIGKIWSAAQDRPRAVNTLCCSSLTRKIPVACCSIFRNLQSSKRLSCSLHDIKKRHNRLKY